MMARTFFNRYIWLIDTIRRAKCIPFKELSGNGSVRAQKQPPRPKSVQYY